MNKNQESKNLKTENSKVENKLKKVIDDCKSIVRNNSTVLQIKSSKCHQENVRKENITLEKVLRDMSHVLHDLKNGVKLMKATEKTDSSFEVEKELEKMYQKQELITKTKGEEKAKKIVTKRPRKPSHPKTTNNQTKKNNPSENSNKTIISVTTVKFPQDAKKQNLNKNAQSTAANEKRPNGDERSKTCPQPSLRKPSQDLSRKIVSIPPPREIYNPLGILKDELERAKRDRKIFTIKGAFPAVRKALLKRGWVEKYHANHREKMAEEIRRFQQMSIGELVDLLRNKEIAGICKKLIKSKLLKDYQVDLYWDHTFDAFKECPDSQKLTLINRFRREPMSYTSKQGLCQAARDAHWLHIPGVACINHPRCYVLAKGGDTKSFVKDFNLTAAVSLLKWIVKNNITGECKVVSESGKIPMKTFEFAITECYKFVKKEKHQDIDEEIKDAMEQEWTEFVDHYYKAVHIGNHFKTMDGNYLPVQVANDMVRKANYLLNEIREHMPFFDMDGYMNIWILKPTNSSRGQGIHICRSLQYILDIVKKNPNRRYIIQKYIERPFLIHDTKFDIRQWFLVSSSYPMTIWLYKNCYLRFSSQTYNLRKLHESIHLTNNSVQSKYKQNVSRDPLLPTYGMWDSQQFKNYLSDIGYHKIFEDTIYPGMKQSVTGAMIAHRDKIDKRGNCFELYGADFMIAENFEPWLLEINSNPALHASTPVTARLCPEVLEDVIKVVVDYARNNKASTGKFELIYKENLDHQNANYKANFKVSGKPLPEDYFCDTLVVEEATPTKELRIEMSIPPDPSRVLIKTGESMKEALKNLLLIVKKEKMKRYSRREKSIETYSVNEINSSTQTRSDVVSLYQNVLSKKDSDHSQNSFQGDMNISQEDLTEDESKRISEVLSEVTSLQNKRELLSNLIKVAESIKMKKRK